MRWMVAVAFLVVGPGLVCAQTSVADQQAEIKFAEDTLKQANLPTDGAGLLKFFQERTLSAEEQGRLALLVQSLGDVSYKTRAKATFRLLRAGTLALPFLKEGLNSTDEEVVRRSEICLQQILENSDAPQVAAAVRLLADRKPAGAAQTLLAFLPFASGADVIEQIRVALPQLAVQGGKPDASLVAALRDPFAIKRAAAGEALARVPAARATVLELLQDPQPEVCLQVAMALVRAEEARAVPALIDVLGKVGGDANWQIEDVLHRLAGEHAPKVTLDRFTPAEKVRKEWHQWWQAQGRNIQEPLAEFARGPAEQGLTLITQMSQQGGTNGQVMEVNRKGEIRWKIDGLRYPLDAQVVGPNRVLVVEYLNRQVSERDFQGNVVWSRPAPLPIGCQRLANGNTFIATRRELMVVERGGKVVFTHHPNLSISAARMMRNGHFVLVTTSGQCLILDGQGKQLNSFQAGPVYTMGGNIEVLANGRILIPEYRLNKVVEYTPDGKIFWQANIRWPTSAVRLTNGNTLVVSMMEQRVVELNRDGQVVWEFRPGGRPWRALRR
jgi:hypothetical protein